MTIAKRRAALQTAADSLGRTKLNGSNLTQLTGLGWVVGPMEAAPQCSVAQSLAIEKLAGKGHVSLPLDTDARAALLAISRTGVFNRMIGVFPQGETVPQTVYGVIRTADGGDGSTVRLNL